jgi:fructose-bisphosphate aldolase, class II
MPLVPLARMLADATRLGYGVCYCESWNLESMQAVVEAAEDCRAPIIAGFNGGFLRHHGRKKPESLAYYAAFRLALEQSPAPVSFLLNESDRLEQMEEGMDLGFNSVMPDNEGLSLAEYETLVSRVVALAHPRGVWVEAQLGVLPNGGGSRDGHSGNGARAEVTDPDAALRFVERTRVDALAVSIGNVHVLTSGKATVDLDVLRRIRERVDVPLVLHGGTSLECGSLRELVRLGVAKFNFGTVLKQAYLEAVRDQLAQYRRPASPHRFLGMGGDADIMVAGREAVKAKVQELLAACGAIGRAEYDFIEAVPRCGNPVR